MTCPFCQILPGARCGATTPGGHVCTRAAGHQYDHVACEGDHHDVHRWSPVEQCYRTGFGLSGAERLLRRAAELIEYETGRDVAERLFATIYCDECGELTDDHASDCVDRYHRFEVAL